MCGICGYFNLQGKPAEHDTVARMAKTLEHRGPDDCGHLVTGSLAFGFRRLSIIDLQTGHQPLANEDGSVHVICNGEIFNYVELREELVGRGHQFRTCSDVEVLVHLYEESGEGLLERINGQFAFAIFDQPKRRLLLGRDPVGVAPLFYTTVGDTFIFGSEIKAVVAHPQVERKADLTGLDQVMSLPGLVSPRTMFAGLLSLPPGHCITVDAHGLRTRCYWDLCFPREDEASDSGSESFYQGELERRLLDSVRRRLRADVPVGSYLSGGLDSSLITSMMQANCPQTVKSFSITFGDRLIDERKYQRMVADAVGCSHHEIELDVQGVERGLKKAIWHAECPLKESYNTASLALSDAARAEGVPVVLSGEGADELFAGYPGYRFDAFRRSRGVPQKTGPREAELRLTLWGDQSIFYEKDLTEIEDANKQMYAPPVAEAYEHFGFARHRIVDGEKLRGVHPLNQRSYLDMKLRLGDHLLGDHGDRMLLANAVEGRFPFLDVEVANFACQMPPDLKMRGYEEKYILKEISRKYIPKAIIEREKYGFNAWGSPQLLRMGSEWVEHLLSPDTIRRQGYFNPAQVTKLKARYSEPNFRLNVPYEDDLLLIVLTFGMFLEAFDMPRYG